MVVLTRTIMDENEIRVQQLKITDRDFFAGYKEVVYPEIRQNEYMLNLRVPLTNANVMHFMPRGMYNVALEKLLDWCKRNNRKIGVCRDNKVEHYYG